MKIFYPLPDFFSGRKIILFAVFVFFSGIAAGRVAGFISIEKFIMNQSRFAVFYFRPSYSFYTAYQLVNADSELQRLAGYYTLFEHRMIDVDFFTDRFEREGSPVIKKSIIWILGFSEKAGTAKSYLAKIFNTSDPPIQREILRSLRRLDSEYLSEFIAKNKVSSVLLMGL